MFCLSLLPDFVFTINQGCALRTIRLPSIWFVWKYKTQRQKLGIRGHRARLEHRPATTVEPLFRGHPRDQGKCPLNGGWAEVCSNKIFFFYSASESAVVIISGSKIIIYKKNMINKSLRYCVFMLLKLLSLWLLHNKTYQHFLWSVTFLSPE